MKWEMKMLNLDNVGDEDAEDTSESNGEFE